MRSPLLPALIAGALGVAACGGTDDSRTGTAAAGRQDPQESALKFARCMREHGVDMPDPQVDDNGLVRIAPGSGMPAEDAAFRKAGAACDRHLQGGAPQALSEADKERLRDAGVAYARCMRDQGVDMPDPDTNGGIVLRVGSGALDPEDPTFRRAEAACRDKLPELQREASGGDGR